MLFKKGITILYSSNVAESLAYYMDKLAFDHKWEWDHPPTFGGVSKNSVEIFFCEKGQGSPGTWLSIFMDNVDEYYTIIKEKGAKILAAPQDMEWGVREMLVEDPDGHRIRFGHSISIFEEKEGADLLPKNIRIITRVPTPQEYNSLVIAVGWAATLPDQSKTETVLAAPVFGVVAEDSEKGETIGCALLLGDGASFYYVKDVMVRPDWQCKRVGTALMQVISNWLEKNAPDNAYVGLFTGSALSSFYQQFGFSTAFGMHRRIRHHKPT